MSDSKSLSLYYVACLVSSPVKEEIMAFMKEIERMTGAKHAQKSPPHITLFPPFKMKSDNENQVIKHLKEICKDISPFEVRVNGVSGFAPRVVYVNPVKNMELSDLRDSILTGLEESLGIIADRNTKKPFNPHITIANRDLKKEDYSFVIDYFKKIQFERTYSQNNLSLLKHNGKFWDVYDTISFGPHL
ncbi:2'-5' RNA ligase family protein [Marinigracilibium pacificum]|uniref:2'-5' RNA ligase family protein n=1 Tax=Marinigracilibium pacificum TaxID=2729599 RepID=A0A848J721_9BACT|nr:2'-5' RNA ligase family protein [Marinigracilibium pacificum]NMM50189.1 2'-5' RNA ligase family protein [Marinigracilibium pacificum]